MDTVEQVANYAGLIHSFESPINCQPNGSRVAAGATFQTDCREIPVIGFIRLGPFDNDATSRSRSATDNRIDNMINNADSGIAGFIDRRIAKSSDDSIAARRDSGPTVYERAG